MTKPTLSSTEALEKIAAGESITAYTVLVDTPLDGAAAFTLRKHGVAVADELITYTDNSLADDPDFDDEPWEPLTTVDLRLYLPAEVASWLATAPATEIVGQLVEQFYAVYQEVEAGKGKKP